MKQQYRGRHPEVYYESKAGQLFREGKISEALTQYFNAVYASPDSGIDPLILVGLQTCIEAVEDEEKRLKFFGMAIEACGKDESWFYLVRGDFYAEKGEYENAMSDFNAASKIDPDSYWLHASLADLYKKTGRVYESLKEMVTAQEQSAKLTDFGFISPRMNMEN